MALSKIRNDSLADTAVHGRRNLIINGAMRVHQRGGTNTGQGFVVDRMRVVHAGGATTSSQGTVSSGTEPYNEGFRYTYKLTNTTAGSSASADYAGFLARLEGQDLVNTSWQQNSTSSYMTLSFWVKSSLAGTYGVSIRAIHGTGQMFTKEFELVADTWKKVSYSFPGDANITINNDNSNGFQIQAWAYLGTNFTTSSHSLDTWKAYSGSDQGKDYQQNWKSTASATYEITGVQLEVGDTATPFEHRSYGEELALCQRYYQVYDYHDTQLTLDGYYDAYNYLEYNLLRPVVMRADPTSSVTYGTTSGLQTQPHISNNDKAHMVNVSARKSSSAGRAYFFLELITADAEL